MNRIFPWLTLVVACGGCVAACSSSPSSPGGVSQKTCALVSACGGVGTFFGFGSLCELLDVVATVDPSHLGSDGAILREQVLCGEAANDCAAVQACLTVPASAAAVCNGATSAKCSNGYAVQCGQAKIGGLTLGSNCAGAGLVCTADSLGAACGTGSCNPATTQPTCDGDNLVTCSEPGGALSSTNCKFSTSTSCMGSSSGSSCQTQVAETCAVVNGKAQCVGTGPACDATTFKNRCDGTSIVSCTGGKTARFDCTSQVPDSTCQMQSDGSAACVGTGTQCTSTTPETCANGVITYCMWGVKTTVDCKSYGLSGCTTSTGGSGPTRTACTP
jgi:hypothetical protein